MFNIILWTFTENPVCILHLKKENLDLLIPDLNAIKMKYHLDDYSKKTLVLFDKIDKENFYDFLSSFDNNYYLGIYASKNNKIAKKIDEFQGAFLKKKLDFFKKNISYKKDLKDNYLDLVLLKNKSLYDYLFEFLFVDFFFENIFLINSDNIHSDFISMNNLIDLKTFLISSTHVVNFGYTHRGEKVLTINTSIYSRKYLEKIEGEQIKNIIENTVIFALSEDF